MLEISGRIPEHFLKQALVTLVTVACFTSLLQAEERDAEQIKKDYLVSGLNEKGVQYLELGKWKQALFNFEKSFEINPKNDVVRQNLLVAYMEALCQEGEAGNWKEAAELGNKAARVVSSPADQQVYWGGVLRYFQIVARKLPPSGWQEATAFIPETAVPKDLERNIAISFHNLAVQAIRRKSLSTAEFYLLRSLKTHPSFEAYSLLGDVYYQEQKLPQAQGAWQGALSFKKTPELAKKLERLAKEIPVEESLEEFETEHFIIRWNKTGSKDPQEALGKTLEMSFQELERDLAVDPGGKIVVLFYDPEQFYTLNDAPHWAGGFYDGKMRLPYASGAWERNYKKVVAHELTHAFIAALSRGNCPIWLNEGLAQVEENKIEPVSLTIFLAAKANGALFSLEEMNRAPEKLTDPLEIAIFYQEAFLLAKYLVDQYGWEAVSHLLGRLGRGTPFPQAFFEMTRKDFRHFEIEWLAHFKSR